MSKKVASLQMSTGHRLKIPRYSRLRLLGLTFLNGLMKLVRQIMPPSANSLATSEMRRMFSSRSGGLKPRSRLIPCRMLSACKLYAGMPLLSRYSSMANAMLLFPAANKPVITDGRLKLALIGYINELSNSKCSPYFNETMKQHKAVVETSDSVLAHLGLGLV